MGAGGGNTASGRGTVPINSLFNYPPTVRSGDLTVL